MKTKPKVPSVLVPASVASRPVARLEWKRVLDLLENKLDPRDINLVEDYCITYADICKLREEVDEEGTMLQGPKGGMYMHPKLTTMMNRQAHLAALRRDLYFTPKSRIEKQQKASLRGKSRSIREDNDDAQGDD